MKTRLEEIIEEESGPGGWFVEQDGDTTHLGPTMRRIAERAFRHGVELGQFAGWIACKNGHGVFMGQEVQPAPARERHPEQDAVHAAQAERYKPAPAEEKVPMRCPTCGGLPHPYPPSLDRRKGERRVQLNGTYWVATGGNRRCCDRRKP